MKPKYQFLIALMVLVLTASACGARLNDEQRTALRAGARGASSQTATDAATGDSSGLDTGDTGDASADNTGSGNAVGGATASGNGTTATTSGTQSGAAVDPTKLPAGGNGGATDTGVSANSVTIGNIATLTGPVPGLFAGAPIGAQAVFAYQNSLGGLWGRKFKVDARDDQFDTGQNRSLVIEQLGKVFSFVGSFSLFDDAAVPQIKASNIPDLSRTLSPSRVDIPNNFSIQPQIAGAPLGPFNYFKKRNPDAITKVGTIYADVPSAKMAYDGFKAAATSVGFKFLYERGYSATETDFTSDVIRMRDGDVKMVYLTAVDDKTIARFAKAMQAQNFKPEVFNVGATGYDTDVVALAGSAVNGMLVTLGTAMYNGEDAQAVSEVALMDKWIQKIKPGFVPDQFAAYSWAEGRLLIKAIEMAGPKFTRATVNDAIRKIGDFGANGLFGVSNPGAKGPDSCFITVQVSNGKYSRYESPATGYRCDDGGYYVMK